MKTKHTPGPWRYRVSTPYIQADDRIVASTWVDGQREPPTQPERMALRQQAQANARLIAAAPDMLAALRDAVDYMTDCGAPDYDDSTLDCMRKAIAKAEGRA